MPIIEPTPEGVNTPPDDQGIHPYGFTWGPLDVSRLCMARRGERVNYVLGVATDHRKVEVCVSEKGRSVRVWIDGDEVTARG